ncbi:hypothetical protein GIB67_027706 [Kingdonia uniflora]|uniref:Uncharacterized protein n=1 Tax=Kingdonia uniflora TaxID=39325 RepID=A0A7J7NLV6_9MAGN|nr:hypothetical protein GIB67_027706 [Kingdonia uniflora]
MISMLSLLELAQEPSDGYKLVLQDGQLPEDFVYDLARSLLKALHCHKQSMELYVIWFQDGGAHSYASDFWPHGCILYEYYTGRPSDKSQSDTNASIPIEAAAPQKEKGKGRMKRALAKPRQNVQVPKDANFLDETNDGGLHWMEADLTCLARAWVTASIQTMRSYKEIVTQERFRNSIGKIEEDRENDAHKIYQDLNGGNNFKHREANKFWHENRDGPT